MVFFEGGFEFGVKLGVFGFWNDVVFVGFCVWLGIVGCFLFGFMGCCVLFVFWEVELM